MPGSERQNNMFEPSPVKQYVQKGNPMPVTSCGRRRNDGSPLFKRKRKPDVKKLQVEVKTLIKLDLQVQVLLLVVV